jgi:hypothetical protein
MGGASDVRRRRRVYLSAVTVNAIGTPVSSRIVSPLLVCTRSRFSSPSSPGMLL